MFPTFFSTISLVAVVGSNLLSVNNLPAQAIIATHEMPLNDRYANTFVNEVFDDNILLTLAYLRGIIPASGTVTLDSIKKPFSYTFILKPQETFAFHDSVLPVYAKSIVKTTNAHFSSEEGFKSDGYLIGDGVCHLASLFYWAAKDAGLAAFAPTNHNFAHIPDIPKEYGVAIYDSPDTPSASANQNLYITNNTKEAVGFTITYDGVSVKIEVVRLDQ